MQGTMIECKIDLSQLDFSTVDKKAEDFEPIAQYRSLYGGEYYVQTSSLVKRAGIGGSSVWLVLVEKNKLTQAIRILDNVLDDALSMSHGGQVQKAITLLREYARELKP